MYIYTHKSIHQLSIYEGLDCDILHINLCISICKYIYIYIHKYTYKTDPLALTLNLCIHRVGLHPIYVYSSMRECIDAYICICKYIYITNHLNPFILTIYIHRVGLHPIYLNPYMSECIDVYICMYKYMCI
jgi:hypothetical protein